MGRGVDLFELADTDLGGVEGLGRTVRPTKAKHGLTRSGCVRLQETE